MFNLSTLFNVPANLLLSYKNSLLILIIAFAVTACQTLPTETKVATHSGFGGTGKTEQQATTKIAANKGDSGFGGTGKLSAHTGDSGFGGTGIVGTITEFGSIWVNGVRVQYDKKVKIVSSLSDKDTLKLGQQVVVETQSNKQTPWTNTIRIYYPLAGEITQVIDNQITVDGQIVYITKETKIGDGIPLKVGAMVAINGYPDSENNWTATRISHNPEAKHLYKLTPDISFSKNIKRVLIETSKSQLTEWNNAFTGLPINLIENPESTHNPEKYLLMATIKNGKISSYDLHEYKIDIPNQILIETDQINELKEVFELQKNQRRLVQDQLDQQKQLNDIQEQMQTVGEIKGHIFNRK